MHASNSSTSTHRARWAAIGAAVAVSLGAGGLGIVNATSPEGASAYVPISPCRLLDTRADSPVGSPLGALGPDTEITLEAWGAHGNCTLPTATTGLELNVTAVDASTLTNLRVYPEGVDTPTASNLNPAPGEPPTPNSVTAPLNTTNGQFHVFNRFGTVHIVIDVVGYYTDHMHDGDDIIDETLTGADVMDESVTGADIDNGSITAVDILDEAGIATQDSSASQLLAGDADVEIVDVEVRVPADGWLKVDVAGNSWGQSNDRDWAQCQITKESTVINDSEVKFNITDHDGDDLALIPLLDSFASHRVFPVSAADNPPFLSGDGQDFSLICTQTTGSPSIVNATITATYYSTNREASGLSLGTLGEDPADG